MNAFKCYLFSLMWQGPHGLKANCLIPGVAPWRFKVSSVFRRMIQFNNGGQQGSFLHSSMILITLKAERFQFSSYLCLNSADKLIVNMMKLPWLFVWLCNTAWLIHLVKLLPSVIQGVLLILLHLTFSYFTLFNWLAWIVLSQTDGFWQPFST